MADRDGEAFGVHDVCVGGDPSGTKVFSTGDVDLLDIQAGDGVNIQKSGHVATISMDGDCVTDVVSGSDEIGCSRNGTVITVTFEGSEEEEEDETTGYTGTENVVTRVTYDTSTHNLTRFFKTFTFSNGVLTNVSNEQSSVIETAVQEAAGGN